MLPSNGKNAEALKIKTKTNVIMAAAQTFDIFMSKFSIWKAYKSGLGLKFGTKPNSHQLIIQEVFIQFADQNWRKKCQKEDFGTRKVVIISGYPGEKLHIC